MGLYKRIGSKNWWMSYTVEGRQRLCSTGTADRGKAEAIYDSKAGLLSPKGTFRRASITASAAGVYVIFSPKTKLVKIGRASNLCSRLARIQTDCPDRVEIFAVIPCTQPAELESWLHRQFQSVHSHGEWFAADWVDIATALAEFFATQYQRAEATHG